MKSLKIVAVVVAVIIVFVLALVVTGGSSFKDINYAEYKNLDSSKAVVYIGNDGSVIDILKKQEIRHGYDTYYLDYSSLSNDEKSAVKAESLEVWKDNELIDSTTLGNFKLAKGDKSGSLKTVDIDEYIKLKDSKGVHFMFIGRETCGYCQQFKEAIAEFHKEYKLNIYYIDTDTLDQDGFNRLVGTERYLSTEEWGTPTSFIYNDGVLVEQLNGYVDVNGIVDVVHKVEVKKFLMNNKVI